MAVLNPTSIAFKYVSVIFYATEILIVSLILLMEIKTFYYNHIKVYLESGQTPSEMTSMDRASSMSTSRSHSNSPKATSNKSASKLQYIIPMISYLLYIIAAIQGVIVSPMFHKGMTPKSCTIMSGIGISAYFLAKITMYFVFIYRVHIVYSDSAFAYKSNILLALVIAITLITLAMIITNALTMDAEIYVNIQNERVCSLKVFPVVLILWIVIDNAVSILCCYLFITPLLKLRKIRGTENRCNANWERMYHLLLKYVILTVIIVFTTLIVLTLMAILKINAIGTVDVMINCCCMALFNKHYIGCYIRICRGAIAVGHKCYSKSDESAVDD